MLQQCNKQHVPLIKNLFKVLIIFGIICWLNYNNFSFIEILVIGIILTIISLFFDQLPMTEIFNNNFRDFLPKSEFGEEILSIAKNNPKLSSIKDCAKINSNLLVNSIKKVNNAELKLIYDECKKKSNHNVRFNERVQVVSSTGSIDTISLSD